VQPHRQIERGHAIEQRQVLRPIERLALDVGKHLDAARPEIADGALGFAHRRVGVAKRQRRDKAREPFGILPHQLRHTVVGGPRQGDAVGARRIHLDRRRRDREHLVVVVEPIHHAEPLIEIDQHRDAAHPLADVLEGRRHPHHQVEIRLGINVIEDVDLAHGCKPILLSG
jgi:hypothetical protein